VKIELFSLMLSVSAEHSNFASSESLEIITENYKAYKTIINSHLRKI
jgi:hypothetical protein